MLDRVQEVSSSKETPRPVLDFNTRILEASVRPSSREQEEAIISISHKPPSSQPGVIQNAFDRIRPRRVASEIATITVGSKTFQSQIGTPASKRRKVGSSSPGLSKESRSRSGRKLRVKTFVHGLKSFAAPGTQAGDDSEGNEEEDDQVEETELAEESSEDEVEVESDEPNSNELEADDPASRENERAAVDPSSESESSSDYIDDEDKKVQEDARVTKLIEDAEAEAVIPSEDSIKRAEALSNGETRKKDSIVHLVTSIKTSASHISDLTASFGTNISTLTSTILQTTTPNPTADTPEARLSLTVSKGDFSTMQVSGQFNLGFILATRHSSSSSLPTDLFIIDQHASDEKYNFERLQATTIVQNQRLVQPLALDLTAIEEETIIDCLPDLEKNGFVVSVDTSGATPVGRRCQLLSLPMSKEVVFNHRDLEELLVLLAERSGTEVPRPTKVRKMFAMRACRSSIMIGKTLTRKQMQGVVRRMGEIEKPWNCPHGRPTMRHLVGLGEWESWAEDFGDGRVNWANYSRNL